MRAFQVTGLLFSDGKLVHRSTGCFNKPSDMLALPIGAFTQRKFDRQWQHKVRGALVARLLHTTAPALHKNRKVMERERTAEADKRAAEKKAGRRNGTSTSFPAAPSKPTEPNPRPKADLSQPFNLADLEWGWTRAALFHEGQLRMLHTGGRFTEETLRQVPVQPDKSDPKTTVPLAQLAHVSHTGGRRFSILCFEAASKRPIKSAVQKSDDFNQQPQDVEDNPLELVVTAEPERLPDLERRLKAVCHGWRTTIRTERGRRDKLIKRWLNEKAITLDDKRRIDKVLQDLQDKRMAEVDKREKEVGRQINAEQW